MRIKIISLDQSDCGFAVDGYCTALGCYSNFPCSARDEHGQPKYKQVDYSEEQCPVCGYYCLGKGGHGCIDKPALVKINN